jgi:hypothetical protein
LEELRRKGTKDEPRAGLRGGLVWSATEVRGTEVTELAYQTLSWSRPRRLILKLSPTSPTGTLISRFLSPREAQVSDLTQSDFRKSV